MSDEFSPMRLRAKRLYFDLSQDALAKRAGLTQPTVAKYETGRSTPPPARWERLAAALDCSVADLCRVSDDDSREYILATVAAMPPITQQMLDAVGLEWQRQDDARRAQMSGGDAA